MPVTIEALYIYPIKSCAGLSVERAEFNEFGFVDDRKWMIVNDKGVMLTQRTMPSMARIKPAITASGLTLSHPDMESLTVEKDRLKNQKTVKIWSDMVSAHIADQEISDWLTTTLKSTTTLHLVNFDQEQIRRPAQIDRFGDTAKHFTDAAPLLVCNTASLDALNSHLKTRGVEKVSIEHFRPNIVVSGLAPFEEHQYNCLNFPNDGTNTELRLIDHCSRCAMITVDPHTGIKRKNATPFKELADLNTMPDNPRAPAFGVNACITANEIKGKFLTIGLQSK